MTSEAVNDSHRGALLHLCRGASFALLLFATVSFVAGCNPPKPRIRVKEVDLAPSGGKRLNLIVGFEVYNPYFLAVKLRDFNWDMRTAELQLGKGGSDLPDQRIAPRGKSVLRVSASLGYAEIREVLGKLYRDKPVKYKLKGKADFSLLWVPIPVHVASSGKLKPPKLPGWLRKGMRWTISAKPVDVDASPTQQISNVEGCHGAQRY